MLESVCHFRFFIATLALAGALGACRPINASSAQRAPIVVYPEDNYKGGPTFLTTGTIYKGASIPDNLDQRISSLMLRKGHQVVIGVEEDGVGLSKVLIAAERNLFIPKLSEPFNNRIRFIRVLPWRNVPKRGWAGQAPDPALDHGWQYLWGGFEQSSESIQWTPMAFRQGWLDTEDRLKRAITSAGIQDIIGFNEPDYAPNNKPKNKFLFDQKNAALAMAPMMKTGLRIGSPSLTESGPMRWLDEFMAHTRSQNIRIDFICVHWYDWTGKSRPSTTPNADAEDIFRRFKRYLEGVHERYGLPIWITEFNANPYRNPEVQLEFAKLAIPYLEASPFIERYAWFQPFGRNNSTQTSDGNVDALDKSATGNGAFREVKNDWDTPLTALGRYFRDAPRNLSGTRDVYLGKNNLTDDEFEIIPKGLPLR